MAMVSWTLGSPTNTGWKRRSSAASFSMCLRYSSRVVAPTMRSSPRASIGLIMLPASMAPRSRATMRLSLSPSGTSPATIRRARPSTMAVLPTPGSPISTGLFLVRRESTCTTRRISSSRPITGSSPPERAASVRSRPKRSSAWYLASGSWSVTCLPPRTSVRAARIASRVTPASVSSRAAELDPSATASSRCSVETYWSPMAPASLRARSISRPVWGDRTVSCSGPYTLGMRSSASLARALRAPGSAPARRTTGKTTPSGSDNRATSRCSGSMRWWSLATAVRWATASACWARWVKVFRSMVVASVSDVPQPLLRGFVADDRGGVGDEVAAGRAAGRLQLLAMPAGLGTQLGLEGRQAGLEPVELLGQLDDPAHALEVDAMPGQPLDLQEPLDVPLGVAARVGGGPLGADQALALVDPEGLGVDAGQLGGDRDHEHRPVVRGARPLWHGPPPRLTPCRGASSATCRTATRTRGAARAPCARASRARRPRG